jgi:hypothetical protein
VVSPFIAYFLGINAQIAVVPAIAAGNLTYVVVIALAVKLMKEAKRLTSLTSPRIALRDQVDAIDAEIVALSMADNVNEVELEVKRQEKARLVQQMREGEIRQTEDVSDEALVEMVENAIRDNPNDFPLLTKYYLNAQ